MPPKPRGRPPKKRRNLAGLRKGSSLNTIPSISQACQTVSGITVDSNPIEMYWGWCKYRYREVEKKTFKNAKEAAQRFLEECPKEVIQRFINSWRFMSAYSKGLTGAWAVRKQHRAINQTVMMAIEILTS